MIFITDELGKFEKNIIELAENMGFKECKTIEAIDLFCGISEKNDVLKEKDRYYAFIDIPQYWSVRADGLNGAIYDNKTKKANIYFKNPIEKRMVSRVEWIDRNNTVYRIDYYNKYGYMYCSENVSGGNVTVREFYDRNGDIKVLEQTGPKTYTTFGTRISPKSYRGFADYLEAYLKYNKIYDENIWLTSDEILNKFAWDYGNFKISYLPQNRLNSDLTVITQTIGGKVSVFMVNIVSGMMTMFTGKPLEKLALPVAIGVAEIAVMIVLETTEKRIAVQRVSINNIYADKNYIAYKLNPVGATPLMFASAAFLLPQFMCNGLHYLFPDNADIQWWMDNMRLTSPLGIVVYMVIICLLTIIFSMVMLSPGRTADDLLKSGDSIQDIYAGKPTKRYLIGTVLSFSVISSIIICICQGGPLFLQFGGYVDASLAMLPCSIMMTTGLWISLYREAEVYRNMDRYHTFI